LKGKPLKIIHRDISPQNILITYEGDVKIVDFGIAKAASLSSVTPDGRLKGKAPYMSPEQAAGEKVDRRSDIFSTGILLYELVTQRRMFTGEVMEILAKVRRAEFEAPESVRGGLSPKIYEILHRALAKEVDRRYKSCGEMLVDIEECMFELSWRPTDRGLAEYMKNLFGDEMEDEGPWTVPERPRGGQDWEKVKTGIKEEGSIKRRKQGILYLTPPVLLIVVALIWIFGSREKLVNALNQESFWPPASSSSNDPTLNEALSKKAQRRPGHHTEAQALQEKAAGLVEKRPEEAKSLLLRAVELDPKSVQAHFQLGLAYMALKNSPKATDAYQKVIELEPRFPDAYFNLGYILSMNKNYFKAEEMYSQVVKLAPAYLDEALFNLSVVQEKQGKRKESIGNLEQALKVNPKNELTQKFLKRLKGVS
jgi:serine/threonine protein kinase